MRFGKILKSICLALPLICVLFSCSADNEAFPFIPISESNGESTSEYIMVIDGYASAELINKANELADQIHSKTELPCYVTYYEEAFVSTADSMTVFVGSCESPLVQRELYGMRTDDYLCRHRDGYIIIGGKSDSATENAIDRFIREILPVSTSGSLMPENGGFEHIGNYEISSLTLNGISLNEYTIALPSLADGKLATIAFELRTKIAERTGYWLEICQKDSTAGGKAIYIESPSSEYSEGEAFIFYSPYGITINACNTLGIKRCAEKFTELLMANGTKGKVTVNIDAQIKIQYEHTTLLIDTVVPDIFLPLTSSSLFTQIRNEIEKGSPSTLLFAPMSQADFTAMTQNIYGYAPISAEHTAALSKSQIQLEAVYTEGNTHIISYLFPIGEQGLRIIHISGKSPSSVTLALDNFITDDIPTAVVSHLLGSNTPTPVIGDNELTALHKDNVHTSALDYSFAIYTSSPSVNISVTKTELNYYRGICIKVI